MDLFVDIANKISNVEQLLALEPEELAAQLLFLWQRRSPQEYVNPDNFIRGAD